MVIFTCQNRMYDLSLAIGIMVAIHLSFVIVGIYVLRLDYNAFLGMMVGAGLVSGILTKIFAESWKDKFQAAIKQESQSGVVLKDSLYAALIMIGGTIVSATLLYRQYGIGGWLGLLGANTVVNAVV
jgi:hypothetical protein